MNQFKKLLSIQIQNKKNIVFDWLDQKASLTPPPFYTSMDLRDSGFKIAPVDSNLYPAGFNNLCPEDQRTAPHVISNQILNFLSSPCYKNSVQGPIKRIAILCENNTRNTFYLENLHALSNLIKEAGFDVKLAWLGSLPEDGSKITGLQTASGEIIDLHMITEMHPNLKLGDWIPDLVINNNDFSSGYPKSLDETLTPITPPYQMGWHTRKKYTHFLHYNRLAHEFANLIEIDPWLIQIDTQEVNEVDFNEDIGLEKVADMANDMLKRIESAYVEHSVKRKPFLFVKNNAGTYGMGIMMIRDSQEIIKMNRRSKNKMSVGKNRSEIHSVILQEGIPTATIIDKLAAEPVIYLCGRELIGGFLRSNTERGDDENLNSQGMIFRKLCMSDLRAAVNDPELESNEIPVLELVYGTIARVSSLAAGIEICERFSQTGVGKVHTQL